MVTTGAPCGRAVFLSDGTRAFLRPVLPEDGEALDAFTRALSDRSRYLRYASFRRGLPERELERFTHADGMQHAGVVALVGDRLVGHACFDRRPSEPEAEVGLEVADAFQGRGLGTLLLEALARLARRAGVCAFVGHVQPQDRTSLEVFRGLGLDETARFEDGSVAVRVDLTPTEAFRTRAARRHARARCAHARRGGVASPGGPIGG